MTGLGFDPLDYAIVGAYLALMIGFGLWLKQKIVRFKDYFLAGGMLATPLLVCTLVSTYYELDVTFTTSEVAFDSGLVAWFGFARPYYLAILVAAFLLAGRLKRFSFMTLPDLLEHAYGRGARVVGALACFVYSLPVIAFSGLAVMFEMLGWPKGWGLLVAAGVCGFYTLLGGLWADAITDTVQFLLMCVSLAVAIPPALEWVGGFEALRAQLPAAHWRTGGELSPWLLVSWATVALTVFVEPAFYQRIFAARDPKQVSRALLLGILLWAAYDWACTVVGMAGRAAVELGLLDGALEGKGALFAVCMKTLPVGLKGLFVAGLLAAVMSSVDTYSLLASGNLVYDIYRPWLRPDLDDRRLVRWTRNGVLAVMALAAGVSLLFQKLSDTWMFMASFLTAVVFVPVMGALFLRPRKGSGLAAALAGLAALVLFYALIHGTGEYVAAEDSYRWVLGGAEIWRECAVLFALPVSALGFAAGQTIGRKE